MGRRAQIRTDSPLWQLTGQKRFLAVPLVQPWKIFVMRIHNIVKRTSIQSAGTWIDLSLTHWNNLQSQQNYLRSLTNETSNYLVCDILLLSLLLNNLRHALCNYLIPVPLFLAPLEALSIQIYFYLLFSRVIKVSFHFRKRGRRVMSLKCLKKVKISDTEADSVVPRNDEGEGISSNNT